MKGEAVNRGSSIPLFNAIPDGLWALLSFLLLVLITLFDLITPRGYSFSLFYLVPIAMTAYRFALSWSFLAVLMSSGAWFLASLASGRKFATAFIIVWTVVTRVINYGFFAVIIQRLHKMLVLSRGQVDLLAAANEEKARLLQELNHRVKNSLATVVGLIHFEEGLAADPKLVGSLDRLQNRVKSMAELYDQLFHSADSASVDLAAYLRKIAEYVGESFAASAKGISMEVGLEGIFMDSKRAISLGLVANELLTDAFKYAFPAGGGGKIELRLGQEGGRVVMEIADDGIGLPPDFDPEQSKGFGFKLVAGLVRDLEGGFAIGPGPGALFRISLPLAAPSQRQG